ncbi:MAG: hypothetical protein ACYDER_07730 [Ktedonobacteraceae bacterium]
MHISAGSDPRKSWHVLRHEINRLDHMDCYQQRENSNRNSKSARTSGSILSRLQEEMPMFNEEDVRCQNPQCRKPIALLTGHRRRQYCEDACKQAAHRARLAAARQAEEEATRQAYIERERAKLRERWGNLLPETFDLLQSIRATSWAEQIAQVVIAEREWVRQSQLQERNTLTESLMLIGEQLGFQALTSDDFLLEIGVESWLALCHEASLEHLYQAQDIAHIKLQVQAGRKRLEQLTPQP